MTIESYTRYRRYFDAQQSSPGTVLNGADFDTDFDRVAAAMDRAVVGIANIRRDDGALADQIVSPESLTVATVTMMGGWTPRGSWISGRSYAVKDMVVNASGGNTPYVCVVAHSSTPGSLAGDIAAGKWQILPVSGSNGNGYGGTSGTAVITIGLGSKLVVLSGLLWAYNLGSRVRIAQVSNPSTNYMEGVVTAVGTSGGNTNITVNVDRTVGAATDVSWYVSLIGDVGPTGVTGATGATGAAGATGTAAATSSAVRQTVSGGPLSSGLPSFLPNTATGLSLISQNITSSAPFCVTAANGWDPATGGPLNRVGFSTANLTWTLTNGTTSYLLILVNANGTLTTDVSTTAPVDQLFGAGSNTLKAFVFNRGEMKGYQGTGASAPQAYIVCVGEAVTAGGNVTSTLMYAYNGYYESPFVPTLAGLSGAFISKQHNIGFYPDITDFVIECTTNDQGYVVGQRIHAAQLFNSTAEPICLASTAYAMTCGVNANWTGTHGTTGVAVTLTLASWKYKFVAKRGW